MAKKKNLKKKKNTEYSFLVKIIAYPEHEDLTISEATNLLKDAIGNYMFANFTVKRVK